MATLWHTALDLYRVTLTSGDGQHVTEVFADEPSAVYFVWNFLVHGADFNHYGVYQTLAQREAVSASFESVPGADRIMTPAERTEWFEAEMHRRHHVEATTTDTVDWLPAPSTVDTLHEALSSLLSTGLTALHYVVDCEPYEPGQWGYRIVATPVRSLKNPWRA